MPIHDWTRVLDSSFHAFHSQWGGRLVAALNGGLLPPGYFAMPEQIATRMQTDVLKRRQKSVVVRHKSDHRIVAVLEIVSPANKDRRDSVRDLASKVVRFIESNISALLIDLLPATKHDPHGTHGAIWARYDTEPYRLPEDGPLTLASYIGRPGDPEAFVEPVAVGQILPDMPLFLCEQRYVNVPLEATYLTALSELPLVREELEAPARGESQG